MTGLDLFKNLGALPEVKPDSMKTGDVLRLFEFNETGGFSFQEVEVLDQTYKIFTYAKEKRPCLSCSEGSEIVPKENGNAYFKIRSEQATRETEKTFWKSFIKG